MMEIQHFEEIQNEFMTRVRKSVYCNVATVDTKGRPRSRIMHLIWDGPIGWVITWPETHKAKHLANNPHVSIAYIGEPLKPVYVECTAAWVTDREEKQRVWELHKSIPPPLGFDPEPHYGSIDDKYYGLLQFTPWRVELAELRNESLIWRPNKNGRNMYT
jgi:general stress protein 26